MKHLEELEKIKLEDRVNDIHSRLTGLIGAIHDNYNPDVIEVFADKISLLLCVADYNGMDVQKYSKIFTEVISNFRLKDYHHGNRGEPEDIK